MARKSPASISSRCAICSGSNLASICASCVNYRLNDYNSSLRSSKRFSVSLFQKIERKLEAKKKLEEQVEWRVVQNEKIAKLKAKLRLLEEQLSRDKAKVAKGSAELKVKTESLDFAFSAVKLTEASGGALGEVLSKP